MSGRDGEPLPSFYDDLDGSLEHAFALLERGVADRRSPFHQATVATVAADGRPAARTVVLRGVDRKAPAVRFHTDRRSRKAAELAERPDLVVHLYDHGRKIQLRLSGRAVLHGGDDLARGLWSGMRDMSKACYRQAAAPGTPIDDPAAVDRAEPHADDAGLCNFVPVEVRLDGLEWLYLAARGHRRALFSFGPDGAVEARWLAP